MLYDDLTSGGIICGWEVSTGGELTGSEAEQIQEAVHAANEKHGTRVQMIVPGDSATDHSMDPEMELYAFDLLFGVPAVISDTWGCPAEVTPDAIKRARATASEVTADFWADVTGDARRC